MNDIRVQYQGFHPSPFTEAYLDGKMAELQERSPYGASLHAAFVREGGLLKARLHIVSAAGEFFAMARGRRLREVSRKMFAQINKQLARWKERRHGEGGDHDFSVA